MKKVLTTVFLSICLIFSASVSFAEPLKLVKHVGTFTSSPSIQDSSKIKTQKDSSKNTTSARKPDTVHFLAETTLTGNTWQLSPGAKKDTASPQLKPNWFYSLPTFTNSPGNTFAADEKTNEPEDNNPRVTSMIQLDSLKNAAVMEQIKQENLRKLILHNEQIKLARILQINNLDSLKLQLKTTTVDTIKALLYTRIAAKYMEYDTLSAAQKQHYQNAAINYTIQAIHEYSLYNDSIGLRDAYTNLSKVYYSQKKYTEAKWFILQSNALSRDKKDTPNVISSLLKLAAIKSDIKDYSLAMGDLNEALQLSIDNRTPKTELEVLNSYALLYSNLQDYPKEAMVLKKRDSLIDSLHKADEAQLAKVAALKKKQDLLNKKKQYLASLKKPSKSSPQVKVPSLQAQD